MNESILIVEDNVKLANYLNDNLTEKGYLVNIVTRGDSAVYRIVRDQPDLVLLDIMLPEMNGKQICHTVRNDYRGKILMLTALDDVNNQVSSLNLGADDYVTKPVESEVLYARIAALLRRPYLIDVIRKITFETLEIDLIKKEVQLSGKLIELKPSQFDLLALLAKNADCTFTRDNIMQVLRGHDYDGVDRSIDLKISRLRRKLADNLQKPYRIKTNHGKGYVLISSAWGKR